MRSRATFLLTCLVCICVASIGAQHAAAQVKVISANPNNTTQGTVNLNVIVAGSGFKRGAKAQWFVSGTTNPGGVTVNSTAFDSSDQLTANITVAADAATGNFDIQVTNADGRTGKGTELFSVISSSSSAGDLSMTIVDSPTGFTSSPDLTSDGVNRGVYTDHNLTGGDTCVSATLSSNGFTQIEQNYVTSITHRQHVWCNQSLATPRYWNMRISDSVACGHLGLTSPCTIGPDVINADYERIFPGNAFCSGLPSVEFQFTLNGTGYSVRSDGNATITQGANSCTLTYSGTGAMAKLYQSGTAVSGSFPFSFQLVLEKF
jgi:hypothetical protein